MNNIFSNLVIRNADHPSPDVLQPRLPSLFEPSNPMEASPESTPDTSLSTSPQPVIKNEAEHLGTLSIDRELPLPSRVSIQEPPSSGIKDASQFDQSWKHLEMESDRSMTIPTIVPTQPVQSSLMNIQAVSNSKSIEEIQNDTARSATIMTRAERTSDWADPDASHQEAINVGAHIVHPRTERVTANEVVRLVEPSRQGPGRVDKAMDVLMPREESNHAEPPVVRIHIGRIDVRAITSPPPQPASKPAPAQPRLTLDEYLRQREGRR